MKQDTLEHSAWGQIGSELVSIPLPCPKSELLPGIVWGHAEDLFTPAFWKYQSRMQRAGDRYSRHQLGSNLLEEVSVCLLGGFGMPAELGLAAFKRLKEQGLLNGDANEKEIESALSIQFLIDGKQRKYRFPRQKAKYLANALSTLRAGSVPTEPVELRNFLTSLNGIGPKTASWVVRNHLDTDEVAILDVHIIRAGLHLGLYDYRETPSRDYFRMERKFLDFCKAIDERATTVDAIMWDYMRRLGRISKIELQPVH